MQRRHFFRHVAAGTLLAGCGSTRTDTSAEISLEGEEGEQAEQRDPAQRLSGLRLLTYNVLADPVHLEQRLDMLFGQMHSANADVIALQEVAPWFLEAIERQQWVRDYRFATVDGHDADRGGQAFLSRVPLSNVRSVRLPGRQQRTALLAGVDVGDSAPFVVATTHMESFLEDGPVRAEQLDIIFAALNRSTASARCLCGDLNFGEGEEPDSAHLDQTYVDLWNQLHPGQPGFTWDIERSEMARLGSFPGEGSRRLDRVLLQGAVWQGRSIEIVGEHPLTPDRRVFMSDHFGLMCEIARV